MEDRKDTTDTLHDDNNKFREMNKRVPFISAMTRGLCHGLKKTHEHRRRIQEEIKSALKDHIYSVPPVVSALQCNDTQKRDT